jgi:hypothetical protein
MTFADCRQLMVVRYAHEHAVSAKSNILSLSMIPPLILAYVLNNA